MRRILLGRSGLDVPLLCVGTADLGKQPHGEQVLRRAFELGATWWDTSDTYETEPLVGGALARLPRHSLTISTKTHASHDHEAAAAVKAALERLRTDAIDIMFMHDVRDRADFDRRQGCLHAFRDLRGRDAIRAIGLSSHYTEVIWLAAEEKEIDVVMAPWNAYGRLPDCTGAMREMEEAIRACHAAGKGVVLMKVLDCGRLRPFLDDAIRAAARFKEKHAVCIGVQSILELETNLRLLLGEPVDASILRFLKTGYSDGREAA